MKVAIINAGTKTEVHAPGCADVKKSEKRNRDEAWVIDVESVVDLSHTYWNDQIGDEVDPNTPEGWAVAASWTDEFRILPCVKGLPHDHRAPATDEAPTVDEKTVSVWVGWRVADEAMGRSDDDPAVATLSAKLAAKKPNAVKDRYVKLTRAECTELAAIATDLENAVLGTKGAGPVAYSCRTLRDRLAAAWA